MNFNLNLDYDNLIGHSTLLYGDTNTYKTYQTSKFVEFLLESKKVSPKEISILDFAPSLTKIHLILKGEIIPPRLKSRNKKELYQNARENFKKTSEILNHFIDNPTTILIINDISIYLHIGSIKILLSAISKSNTFFGNTYFGSSIKRGYATLFSLRERRKVKSLINKVDLSYFTG